MSERSNPVQPVGCRILSVRQETAREWTFRVETGAQPRPGQFMQLSIPKVGEAPISVSAAGDGWVEFTIRSVGQVTDCIFTKQPGDTLFLRGPYGHGWPVEQFAGKHMVVVTGGTGLAPVRMLLDRMYDGTQPAQSVSLISGFKDAGGVVFRDSLDRWQQKFHTWYCLDNEEAPGWNRGFVTEYLDRIDYASFAGDYVVVVVGPPPMMKFVGQKLTALGVPEDKIWMSFERKMSCAVGKCGHCRIDEVYVCLDGPVFPYTKAKYLVD